MDAEERWMARIEWENEPHEDKCDCLRCFRQIKTKEEIEACIAWDADLWVKGQKEKDE